MHSSSPRRRKARPSGWVINTVCVVGVLSPIAGAAAISFGGLVPWQYFFVTGGIAATVICRTLEPWKPSI